MPHFSLSLMLKRLYNYGVITMTYYWLIQKVTEIAICDECYDKCCFTSGYCRYAVPQVASCFENQTKCIYFIRYESWQTITYLIIIFFQV